MTEPSPEAIAHAQRALCAFLGPWRDATVHGTTLATQLPAAAAIAVREAFALEAARTVQPPPARDLAAELDELREHLDAMTAAGRRCPVTLQHTPLYSVYAIGIQCKHAESHAGQHAGSAGPETGEVFWDDNGPQAPANPPAAPVRDPASTTAATTQVATPASTSGRRRETAPVKAFGFSQEGRM